MRTIWKYPLEVIDEQSKLMPAGTQVLTVQVQNEQPCLWVIVDTERVADQARRFKTYGTGHPMPEDDGLRYIGTYQLNGGNLVFHVFEVPL